MAELGAELACALPGLRPRVGGVYLRWAFTLMPTAWENAGCKVEPEGVGWGFDARASSPRGAGGSAARLR